MTVRGRRSLAAMGVLVALLGVGRAVGAGSDAPRDRGPGAALSIAFSQDFEDDPIGPYDLQTLKEDWNHPARVWPDGDYAGGAKMEIRQEGGNRFLRHRFDPGDFGVDGDTGISWGTPLPRLEEAYLSFRARCSEVFGRETLCGKLPGLDGGAAPGKGRAEAGERPGPDQGFYALVMFGSPETIAGERRGRLALHPYVYHQEMGANDVTADGRPVYWGNSFGARYELRVNRWYTITERVVMNDPGRSNGLIEIYVDGRLHSARQGFRFRETAAVGIDELGISNFLKHHVLDLLQTAEIVPMVNQMEFHPYLVQQDLIDFCTGLGIQYQAWSPLMQGRISEVELLSQLARKYGKDPAQIVLRWSLQKGVATVPKSVTPARILSNVRLFDFELSTEDVKRIDGLDRGKRFGSDPDHFDF